MSRRPDAGSGAETLHSRFEHMAGTNPDHPAVVAGSDALTYGQLNEHANRIAWRLRQLGVGRGTLVGLSVDRSTDMIAGLLAILKAGGAYIPLDSGYPQEHLKLMLEDSEVPVVLAPGHLIAKLPHGNFYLQALDDPSTFNSYPAMNPSGNSSAQDAAYVVYTSGSTGVPKGVIATHDNVANLVRHQSYLTITPEDRVAALASLSFDASTFEIWGALLNGASCHVYDFAGSNISELFEKVQDDAISILALTSPVFRILEPTHWHLARRVRAILFGGDSVLTDTVVRAGELFPGDLIHVYGPTETTSFCTILKAGTLTADSPLFPIGYPIRGVSARVMGPNGEVTATDDQGELYIGGRGVARGYLKRPNLTEDRFVPDASGLPGSRFYRTGDLVRIGRSGELHFLGRLDRQLKIRGHRIEPAAIESALTQHPGVSDAVVVGRPDGTGDKRLHAYLVRRSIEKSTVPGETYDADSSAPGRCQELSDHELVADIRRHIGAVLPSEQHPATFTIIESIPLTRNLKLDESRLPPPHEHAGTPGDASTTPSKEMEGALMSLWKARLDAGAIGIDDNFFELGGDSMLAIQIAMSAESELGIRIGVRSIFKYPSIRMLADAIVNGKAAGKTSRPTRLLRGDESSAEGD